MSRLAQLRRSVRSRLGIPVTDQFQTDDVIDEHINIAIQTIEQEQRWPWQETVQTVTINDSTGEFTVPADWRATRTIIFDRHQVQVVSPTELLTHPATDTGPESCQDDGVARARVHERMGKIRTRYGAPPDCAAFDDRPRHAARAA